MREISCSLAVFSIAACLSFSQIAMAQTTVVIGQLSAEKLTEDVEGIAVTCQLWRSANDDMQTPVVVQTSNLISVDSEGNAAGDFSLELNEPRGADRAPFINCDLMVQSEAGLKRPVESVSIRPPHRVARPHPQSYITYRGPVSLLNIANDNNDTGLDVGVDIDRPSTRGLPGAGGIARRLGQEAGASPLESPVEGFAASLVRTLDLPKPFYMQGARMPSEIRMDGPFVFALSSDALINSGGLRGSGFNCPEDSDLDACRG